MQWPVRAAVVLALALWLSGCGAPAPPGMDTTGDDPGTPSGTSTVGTSAGTDAPSIPRYLPGIYYSQPSPPGAPPGPNRLVRADGPLERSTTLPPNGFDLTPQWAAATDSQSTILLIGPAGEGRRIEARGLHHIGRPSLDAEATHAAVQANEDAGSIDPSVPGADFNVYVVQLVDSCAACKGTKGSWSKLGGLPVNEESPEWVPGTRLVAYSSFDPAQGIDIHVHDATDGREVARFPGIGGLHLAASADGRRLLEARSLRIYDAATGALEHDLRDEALAGLRAAGYDVDAVHDGMDGAGSFPLDGAFSPDGSEIVFDGAVTGKGTGLLVMRIRTDGTGFQVVAGPVPADPARSNDHNYSQLNPKWL